MRKLILAVLLFLFSDLAMADNFEIIRKEAEHGNASSQVFLGDMYFHGSNGAPRDYAEAAKWYRKAAEQGYVYGQWSLGDMYENGEGVPQDYAEAVRWYRKAAEQGNAWAQFNLGTMYKEGKGVPQNYVQAYMWYNLAASRDSDFAEWRDQLVARMTRKQIDEGQKLSLQWKPKRYK